MPSRRTAQHRAAQRPRRRVQRVRRCPRGIRPAVRIRRGAAAHVFRRGGGTPGSIPVNLGAFRRSEPKRSGTFHRPLLPSPQAVRSRGRVNQSCSRPPPYQRGVPSDPVQLGRATAYPVTSPGLIMLNRSRTSRPVARSRVKNSASLPARSASVATVARRTARAAGAGRAEAAASRSPPGGLAHRTRSLGSVRSAASLPPPYQIT